MGRGLIDKCRDRLKNACSKSPDKNETQPKKEYNISEKENLDEVIRKLDKFDQTSKSNVKCLIDSFCSCDSTFYI